jgi:diguanylate cyclase (GGDEF)-like protein
MDKPIALIIEDDRDIVALFRHVLDLAGYQTEIILHGKAAVERLTGDHPEADIILLDLLLPGVPGTEILHLIRSDERLKDKPVIVVTADANAARSLEDQPELVLLKPVNLEQLSNLVKHLRPVEAFTDKSPTDEVTGLFNRSFFTSLLDYALARSKQVAFNHFAVLLADFDQFKAIEDQLGKEYSRLILQDTARAIKSVLRPTDSVARLEGAQFAILIEEVTNWDIPIYIANRILERLARNMDGKFIQSRSHLGIVLCDSRYFSVNEILKDVKVALSLARAEGRGSYKFYARDEFNNAYDIDLISTLQDNRVMGQTPFRNREIVIKPARSNSTLPANI